MRPYVKKILALLIAACAVCAVFFSALKVLQYFDIKKTNEAEFAAVSAADNQYDLKQGADGKNADNLAVKKISSILSSGALNFDAQPGDSEIPARIAANVAEFIADLTDVLASDDDGLLLLVDKKNLLDEGYEPADLVSLGSDKKYTVSRNNHRLRSCAESALALMADAAKKEGITLLVSSSYRSYSYQKTIYERNVRIMGKEEADRESAFPGASQHQLGTAVDFGSIDDSFAQTDAGKWMAVNAARFGFSLSFPSGYESETGYRWESWHYRYVGKKAAEFQAKWFNNIQQYMLEFINEWN